MPSQAHTSTTSPDGRPRPAERKAPAGHGKPAKVQLEVSQHGSLLTPAVLAVLYDIIESKCACFDQDDRDPKAS
jgi:hypothetical protein